MSPLHLQYTGQVFIVSTLAKDSCMCSTTPHWYVCLSDCHFMIVEPVVWSDQR